MKVFVGMRDILLVLGFYFLFVVMNVTCKECIKLIKSFFLTAVS